MRGGVLAVGVILLIVGFFIFWNGYTVTQEYQTSLGQLGRFFSSEAQEQYSQGQLFTMIGGILALIGFITSIYGAAAKSKP